jgi:ParB-like chromosome segregation protein Spo0J
MAARKLGMEEAPVIVLRHLSEAQRRALVIADNQLALNAGWDEETLRLELTLLQDADYDLRLVGFDDLELARLLEKQEAQAGLTDEDDVPELSEIPVSAPGDLWILGGPLFYAATPPARLMLSASWTARPLTSFSQILPTTWTTRATPRTG